jgi:hypothetical protein
MSSMHCNAEKTMMVRKTYGEDDGMCAADPIKEEVLGATGRCYPDDDDGKGSMYTCSDTGDSVWYNKYGDMSCSGEALYSSPAGSPCHRECNEEDDDDDCDGRGYKEGA